MKNKKAESKASSAMKLDSVKFALAFGVTAAFYLFSLAITAWKFGWGNNMVELLATVFIGYAPGLSGAVLGSVWGFMCGIIFGGIVAWIYNMIGKMG